MIKENHGVFVFAQQVDKTITNVSYELIGKGKEIAQELGTQVSALLVGSGIKELAEELVEYGADRVIVVDDEALETYTVEPYTQAVTAAVKEYKPEILLMGATAIGRDLAPRVAARLHTGLTADCTGLEVDKEKQGLLMTRPAFGGNIMATIECPDYRPQMATVRPGVMVKRLRDKEAHVAWDNFILCITNANKWTLHFIFSVSHRIEQRAMCSTSRTLLYCITTHLFSSFLKFCNIMCTIKNFNTFY